MCVEIAYDTPNPYPSIWAAYKEIIPTLLRFVFFAFFGAFRQKKKLFCCVMFPVFSVQEQRNIKKRDKTGELTHEESEKDACRQVKEPTYWAKRPLHPPRAHAPEEIKTAGSPFFLWLVWTSKPQENNKIFSSFRALLGSFFSRGTDSEGWLEACSAGEVHITDFDNMHTYSS